MVAREQSRAVRNVFGALSTIIALRELNSNGRVQSRACHAHAGAHNFRLIPSLALLIDSKCAARDMASWQSC
eukprot:11170306-Lingulodinium_polyedra.AAC.1